MSKFCKLKDISSQIASGITPSRTNSKYWENGTIPWLKTEQLNEYEIYETSEHITQFALEETSIKIFPVNTLSIAMYGEGKTRGNVAILKTPMTTNQACCNIVVDEKKAYNKFVYYFLKTQYFQLRSLSSGVRKNLNSNDIKEFDVRLPKNLSEQQKIAFILSSLDTKIELNNRINAGLEAMAKTLYDYWFVQFDFPYSPPTEGCPQDGVGIGKPYKSSGGLMVWNEELKREIPEGWEVKELNEISSFISRGISPVYTETGGVCVLNQKCIRNRTVLYDEARQHDNLKRDAENKRIFLYDILVNSTGVGTLGRVAVVNWLIDDFVTVDSHITILRSNDELINKLYFGFSLLEKQMEIERFANGSTGQVELSRSQLESIKLIIPPTNVQLAFERIYKNCLEKAAINAQENQHLSTLRDWLLPMLMNGQVTVAEAEKVLYQAVETLNMAAEPKNPYRNSAG